MATWSPLTNKIRESKDNSGNRTYMVTRITPHCWVGQVSIENGLDYFATTSRQVSSNYIIGSDGRVGGCVREEWRAWTSSSRDNDNRAITIECASDTKSPYAFKTAVYEKLIKLYPDKTIYYTNGYELTISDSIMLDGGVMRLTIEDLAQVLGVKYKRYDDGVAVIGKNLDNISEDEIRNIF